VVEAGLMDSYERTLADLYALEAERGIDLKLERVRRALSLLGSPEGQFGVIHVGGTNGKGSTAAMLEAAFRGAGYRVGLYTSPHLVDFTERIRIDGRGITEEQVVEGVAGLKSLLGRADIGLTFFEMVSVMAFDAFARGGVEIALVEVGLGGRLDATNVTLPVVTVITNVSYDHEDYLGTTLDAIAYEKGGIMKPGIPVVIGPVPDCVERKLLVQAQAVGAPVTLYGRDFMVEETAGKVDVVAGEYRWTDLQLGLRGRFQQWNAAIALVVLRHASTSYPVSEDTARAALAGVYWPGRFDVVCREPLVILDGAHNPAAASELRAELERTLGGRRVRLVFAAMRDKKWADMWEALRPVVYDVVVTQPTLPRSVQAETLAQTIGRDVPVRIAGNPMDAVESTLTGAGPDDAVVVTGSLFLVGEVYPLFLAQQGRRRLFDS
jgi:dihydrofolate synthase/folylpolyglutamate synthase